MDHSVFAVSTIEAENLTHAPNRTRVKLDLYCFISAQYPSFKFQPTHLMDDGCLVAPAHDIGGAGQANM